MSFRFWHTGPTPLMLAAVALSATPNHLSAQAVDSIPAGVVRAQLLSDTYQRLEQMAVVVSPQSIELLGNLVNGAVATIERPTAGPDAYYVDRIDALRARDALRVFVERWILEGREQDGAVRFHESVWYNTEAGICPLWPIC